MKKFILCLLFLLLVRTVSAEIVLTEVMYNPTKASDTDLEWVEIFNNGTEKVNLSSWEIDGKNFGDFVINPKEFVVVARELIDSSDVDNDSFESVYGNNDGNWDSLDGNYRAFDGDFSFTDVDKINLSNGVYSTILEYNTSFGGNGNGYTIEKIDVNKENTFDNWIQSKVLDGTPGYGNVKKDGTTSVDVSVEVTNTVPLLNLVNITDDNSDIGVQVIPSVNSEKNIFLEVNVESLSVNNIKEVTAELNGRKTNLVRDLNSTVYTGNAIMNYFDKPGKYAINVSVLDKFNQSNSLIVDFEYLGLLAISIDKNAVNFGKLEPGKNGIDKIKVINQGNVETNLEFYGQDLESGENRINVSNLELSFDDKLSKLDYRPSLIDFNLTTGLDANKELLLKLNLPLSTVPSLYAGNINLVGVAK